MCRVVTLCGNVEAVSRFANEECLKIGTPLLFTRQI